MCDLWCWTAFEGRRNEYMKTMRVVLPVGDDDYANQDGMQSPVEDSNALAGRVETA